MDDTEYVALDDSKVKKYLAEHPNRIKDAMML